MTVPLSTTATQTSSYPPSPEFANTRFLDATPAFRRQVYSTLVGIGVFFALYVLLIVIGLLIAYTAAWAAIGIISVRFNGLTLGIGLSLVSLAVMFLLFLVKFIFVVHRDENAHRVEITDADHPALFAFINRLTTEVGAPKPYKIFLSPSVNASVFYNSSLWSLFFPVRKNLDIGLGLVNSVNMSEFKAVMAHEFGHFSQRSIKLGSYVYIMNRVIYNLVYDRDLWDRSLASWAASGGIWWLFAGLTRWLVNLVRQVLVKAYQWLNRRYMGLSREMEYQADLVALSAAGGQSAISALRRIEFGDLAYNQTVSYLGELVAESKVAENIYTLQTAMLHKMAADSNLELVHNLPLFDDTQVAKQASAKRVNVQDQWASHPAQAEREANIAQVDSPCVPIETSPWTLFSTPNYWQQQLTAMLYEGIDLPDASGRQVVDSSLFIEYVTEQEQQAQLPNVYRGFYDQRLLHSFDPVSAARQTTPVPDFDTLFSDENRAAIKRFYTQCTDRNTLEQIQGGQIVARTFDFDGIRYKRAAAAGIVQQLTGEIDSLRTYLTELETNAFRWHFQQAGGEATALLRRYQLYFQLNADREVYSNLLERYAVLMEKVYKLVIADSPPYEYYTTIDTLNDEMQAAYAASQAIAVPSTVGSLVLADGYAAFLCADTVQVADSVHLNWENMVVLYNQLQQMPGRVAQVEIAVLHDLIRWQATLIDLNSPGLAD